MVFLTQPEVYCLEGKVLLTPPSSLWSRRMGELLHNSTILPPSCVGDIGVGDGGRFGIQYRHL